ncbi:hypothetical protein LINPERPRIM_LOCUS5597, partial [Linum perenne]
MILALPAPIPKAENDRPSNANSVSTIRSGSSQTEKREDHKKKRILSSNKGKEIA